MCPTSTKDKIKLHIIKFCVKHNCERTGIRDGDGAGRGGCDMIYFSIILISAINYSCTL